MLLPMIYMDYFTYNSNPYTIDERGHILAIDFKSYSKEYDIFLKNMEEVLLFFNNNNNYVNNDTINKHELTINKLLNENTILKNQIEEFEKQTKNINKINNNLHETHQSHTGRTCLCIWLICIY